MPKKLVLILTIVFVLAFVATAFAWPPFSAKWIAKYDGYLQMGYIDGQPTNIVADTLIVVNNAHDTKSMKVWIAVFDKHGVVEGEQTFFDGGNMLVGQTLPANNYGWITLGMIVKRATHDPWGVPAGEKFSFKIFTDLVGTPPIVEVKQIIYKQAQTMPPGEAIWHADNIQTWAEAVLGGLKGPGIIKVPDTMKW